MDDRIDVLAGRIVQEATSGLHRTTFVFVNQVDRARALVDRLSAVRPNDPQLLLLRARFLLEDIIEPKENQVLFIHLCVACAVDIEALGVPTPAYDAQDVVIRSWGGHYGF
jgi:hypothetical protein